MRVVVRARSLRGRSRPCNGTKDIEDLDNPQATETHLTAATKAAAGATRGHVRFARLGRLAVGLSVGLGQ